MTKFSDSYFVNNGDTTKVLLRYPLFESAIYMQTPTNEYRLKNGKVERNDGTGWSVPRTDDPDYHKNLILQADKNKSEEPKNIFKYYFDKIFKHEQGGTMNYAQYLQNGDTIQAPMIDEQALAHQKQVDNQMAEAIKANPEQLKQAIEEYGEEAPSFVKHMIDVAMENQDEDLLKILQPYAEQLNIALSFKCGGKVRAKVKKACGGKKLEKGAKIPAEKKGGCPCQYKKIGGHIKLVDCNGIPVAKDGAVLKFQYPAGRLPKINTQLDINPNLLWGSAYHSQYLWGNGGSRTTVNPTSALNQTMPKSKLDSYLNLTGDEAYRLMHGTAPEVIEQERLAAAEAAASAQPAKQTWRQMFDAGQVKYGGLTKEEALARQKEMQAAKGFNVDLGKWGADGMWGNQSKAEWERYQAWKLDQERAANANLTRLESPVKGLTTTVITPNAMTASNPNSLTLDKNRNIVNLNTLTPGQASQLDNAAWNRYLQYIRNRILSSKTGGKLNYAEYLK